MCSWGVSVYSEGAKKEIITFNDCPASCRCISPVILCGPLGHSGCHGSLGSPWWKLSFFLSQAASSCGLSKTPGVLLRWCWLFFPFVVLLRACFTPCLCDGRDLTKFILSFSWWLFYIHSVHLQLCGKLDPFVENLIFTSHSANAKVSPFFSLPLVKSVFSTMWDLQVGLLVYCYL